MRRFLSSYLSPLILPLAGVVSVQLAILSGNAAHAQIVGPSTPVTLEHADSLIGHTDASGEVNEFIGHVRIVQGVVHIQADRVVLYNATNRAVLTGNVVVTQPGMTMNAPHADYDGNARIATAPDGMTMQEDNATLQAGSGSYHTYERIAYFTNGVTLHDPHSNLKADAGEYYSVERKAIFRGNVFAQNDSGSLSCRNLTYWRDSQESYAVGNVVLIPKGRNARLTGDTARNIPLKNYSLITGSPRLTQVDTTVVKDSTSEGATTVRYDTTTITSITMESFRGDREQYVATDSVWLHRGSLDAIARLARFLPKQNVIGLGSGLSPHRDSVKKKDSAGVRNDSSAITGRSDSSGQRAARLDSNASRANVTTHADSSLFPVVWYGKSQLTGDTVTVGLQQKRLRYLDVTGDAFAVSQGDKRQRFDQLAANRLFFDIVLDTIRRVRSEGSASSIYYASGTGPGGVNRASGDTMIIAFDSGQVSRINIHGRRTRPEGEFFPEAMIVGEESAYRLSGFRWIDRVSATERESDETGVKSRPKNGNAPSGSQ